LEERRIQIDDRRIGCPLGLLGREIGWRERQRSFDRERRDWR
jgi:hypothetical protein